jgi:hypothetical protein
MAVGEGDFPRELLQEEDVGAGTMGEGGEGTDETRGGGGREVEGEEGRDGDVEPHAWHYRGGTCSLRGAAAISRSRRQLRRRRGRRHR